MWVLKTAGKTYYVNHVDCQLPWSTKETPDNSHTKGSIKVKECVLTIDDNDLATISELTPAEKIRLRNLKRGSERIIFSYHSAIHQALIRKEFKHSPFKNITGGCGTVFMVCDLLKKSEVLLAALKYDFRIMNPNEGYYKAYDNKETYIDEDDYYEDDEYITPEDLWDAYAR